MILKSDCPLRVLCIRGPLEGALTSRMVGPLEGALATFAIETLRGQQVFLHEGALIGGPDIQNGGGP